MTTEQDLQNSVSERFGAQAEAYVRSAVHAQGPDLAALDALLAASPGGRVLDLGTGGGHAALTAARHAGEVVALDLSEAMLAAAAAEAARRGLGNLRFRQGSVEALPFDAAAFDWVISRYSAHHWPRLDLALAEARRVIRPGGRAVFMDIVAPDSPLLDTWLQGLELLRDPGHVRNRGRGEWRQALTAAGFRVDEAREHKVALAFAAWVARIGTPAPLVRALRVLQQAAPREVAEALALQADGSFQIDSLTLTATAV